MENNIELFERYIDGRMTAEEKQEFDSRIRSDKGFAMDFRIYLFTVQGICREAEQDNIDFGQAMKNIGKEDLLRIIGRDSRRRAFPTGRIRERLMWAASIAAVLVVGVFSVFNVRRSGMDRLDNTIVAYNYIPESNRGWGQITAGDIPSLENAYRNAPADDLQAREEAGMRLAMAYLKEHDRKKAIELLSDMAERFSDDEEFGAQCRRILDQLK